uniref:CHK domain-containing protein n=1 Tax=Caenorhabditis tropicalis TaxID=1561998 RepID=A0A1I7TQM9_9PELO
MAEKKATILENGDGLFNTHVVLEDVQEVIGSQMNTKARLGENTKYTVVGDGNGFMSRVVLVEPEWTVDDEHLPQKFVLKITSCMHVHGLVEKMRSSNPNAIPPEQEAAMWAMFETESQQLHNREVNLYEITGKWNKNEVMLSPKIYFSKKFDDNNKTKGFLGMEFVDDVTIRHLYANAKPHELHPVLRSLATLQAESLKMTDEEKESIAGYDFKRLMGTMMNEDGMKSIYEQTRDINRDRLTDKANTIEAFGLDVVNFELACNLNKYMGIERDVLVHGDLWAANILWKETDGNFSVSKVIDYQLIHMGNPAEDLVRLFLSTLSGSDRQAHWERLVDQFYEYFLEALGDQEVPYSIEQLKESYRHYFVTGGLIMMPMYGPIAQAKLSYATDTEHVEEYREILTEKAEHLLEDLKRWHIYSRETTKKHQESETTH